MNFEVDIIFLLVLTSKIVLADYQSMNVCSM